MKKLVIGILLLLSVSSFAEDLKPSCKVSIFANGSDTATTHQMPEMRERSTVGYWTMLVISNIDYTVMVVDRTISFSATNLRDKGPVLTSFASTKGEFNGENYLNVRVPGTGDNAKITCE